MTKPSNMFRILSQIVESNPGLLVDHKRDFTVHDKAVIDRASPGQRFLWCLRRTGTQLFPLDGSHDPIWITYYIQGSGRDKAARFYVLDFGPDTVTEIPVSKALRLANEHGKPGAVTVSLS